VVCYTRSHAPVDWVEPAGEASLPVIPPSKTIANRDLRHVVTSIPVSHVQSDPTTPHQQIPTAACHNGPLDFASYLRSRYPLLVSPHTIVRATSLLVPLANFFCISPFTVFAVHLIMQFLQVADEITMILKEHNARETTHMNNTRQNMMMDMFKFSEKLIKSLSKRCICCPARGFSDCPLKPSTQAKGNSLLL
jgi:hypothetical protein